jgi:hypothetical protein
VVGKGEIIWKNPDGAKIFFFIGLYRGNVLRLCRSLGWSTGVGNSPWLAGFGGIAAFIKDWGH